MRKRSRRLPVRETMMADKTINFWREKRLKIGLQTKGRNISKIRRRILIFIRSAKRMLETRGT